MSQSRLLSDTERDRFATWLEQEAEGDKIMMEQMEKLGPCTKPIIEHFKLRIMAYLLIARELRKTESMTIGD